MYNAKINPDSTATFHSCTAGPSGEMFVHPTPRISITPDAVAVDGRDATPHGYTGWGTHAWMQDSRLHVKVEDGTLWRATLSSIAEGSPAWERCEWTDATWTVRVHTLPSGRHVVADDGGWLPGEYDTIADAIRAAADSAEGGHPKEAP